MTERTAQEMDISLIADEAVNLLEAGGFRMDPQQKSAFRSIQAALASSMQLDSRAMTRVHKGHGLDRFVEGLPAVYLAHADLAGCQERPE